MCPEFVYNQEDMVRIREGEIVQGKSLTSKDVDILGPQVVRVLQSADPSWMILQPIGRDSTRVLIPKDLYESWKKPPQCPLPTPRVDL